MAYTTDKYCSTRSCERCSHMHISMHNLSRIVLLNLIAMHASCARWRRNSRSRINSVAHITVIFQSLERIRMWRRHGHTCIEFVQVNTIMQLHLIFQRNNFFLAIHPSCPLYNYSNFSGKSLCFFLSTGVARSNQPADWAHTSQSTVHEVPQFCSKFFSHRFLCTHKPRALQVSSPPLSTNISLLSTLLLSHSLLGQSSITQFSLSHNITFIIAYRTHPLFSSRGAGRLTPRMLLNISGAPLGRGPHPASAFAPPSHPPLLALPPGCLFLVISHSPSSRHGNIRQGRQG